MRISDLTGREVGLLGFGREGRATHDALRAAGHQATLHAFADRAIAVPEGVHQHVGEEGAATAMRALDVLVRSPGFAPHHPLRRAADAARIVQTTATNLFLSEARWAGWPVIGVTGSKGKSTTSTLAHLALQEAGIASELVGNVGVAALERLDRFRREKLVAVLEMSSYQCADLEDGGGPSVACLLDLFPEHMDWHGGVDGYYAAKARIGLSQCETDALRYNTRALDALAPAIGARLRARPAAFVQAVNTPPGLHYEGGWFMRGAERLVSDERMVLAGAHNRENAVAALAATELLGVRAEHLERVLASFRGLPYRLQDEGVHGGIRWINDSLSTAPEVVAVALRALGRAVSTVIAGGQDRGYDPGVLVEQLRAAPVATLIVLPDTGAALARQVRACGLGLVVREAANLDEAVALAVACSPAGTTCLFSPGAPSYNAYASFEERGRHFRRLVEAVGRGGRHGADSAPRAGRD
jgi:UDP-N-acetylmuramoylalanine--D-glutamate ligase